MDYDKHPPIKPKPDARVLRIARHVAADLEMKLGEQDDKRRQEQHARERAELLKYSK